MTFDIDAKPESPRLPLFGRGGAYFCLTSEFSWKCASSVMYCTILHVLFLQTKLKRVTAKVWQ